jgi:hypothetical protein
MKIPLSCPKCSGSMKHHLAKKMYKIHGFCFDCTLEYEASLRKAGLYKKYEANMINGSIDAFSKDLSAWVNQYVDYNPSYVTEAGDIEDWHSNDVKQKNKVLENLKEFISILDKAKK